MLRSFVILSVYLGIGCVSTLPAITALKFGRGLFRNGAVLFSVLAFLPPLWFFLVHLVVFGWLREDKLYPKLFLFEIVPLGLAWLCAWIAIDDRRKFDRARERPTLSAR